MIPQFLPPLSCFTLFLPQCLPHILSLPIIHFPLPPSLSFFPTLLLCPFLLSLSPPLSLSPQDLQLLTLPESKYVHAVQLSEGGYSLASNGDPNQDTVFTIERYANGGTGPSHYYKMRRRGTQEYVYVNENGLILIEVRIK